MRADVLGSENDTEGQHQLNGAPQLGRRARRNSSRAPRGRHARGLWRPVEDRFSVLRPVIEFDESSGFS